jgi:hypothetical protein
MVKRFVVYRVGLVLKASSCWERTRRVPAGRIPVFEAVEVGRVFEELLTAFNSNVLSFGVAIKFHRE